MIRLYVSCGPRIAHYLPPARVYDVHSHILANDLLLGVDPSSLSVGSVGLDVQ